jgi:hypothetical protein
VLTSYSRTWAPPIFVGRGPRAGEARGQTDGKSFNDRRSGRFEFRVAIAADHREDAVPCEDHRAGLDTPRAAWRYFAFRQSLMNALRASPESFFAPASLLQ